jgi:hypothetical protein
MMCLIFLVFPHSASILPLTKEEELYVKTWVASVQTISEIDKYILKIFLITL